MDDSDEGDIDTVFTNDFVGRLEAEIVDEITMEEDFFGVIVKEGETFADDDTEVDTVTSSDGSTVTAALFDNDPEEDNVTSSDGSTLTAALYDADVEVL